MLKVEPCQLNSVVLKEIPTGDLFFRCQPFSIEKIQRKALSGF
jgi:hypothetical protein